jgi:hypothetical protein
MGDNRNFPLNNLSLLSIQAEEWQWEKLSDIDIAAPLPLLIHQEIQLFLELSQSLIRAEHTLRFSHSEPFSGNEFNTCSLLLSYVFEVMDLSKWLESTTDGTVCLHPSLQNAIANLSYSCSRGYLFRNLQGTALEGFILPLAHPSIYLT